VLLRLGSALVLLLAVVGLLLWASAPRSIWQAEASTGFALDLPDDPPPGMALSDIRLVPSSGGAPSHVAELAYAGRGQARLQIFESPYPLGPMPLKPGDGPVIIGTAGKGAPLVEGFERVGGLYVQADARGLGEPAFAACLASLRPVDGGIAYVLLHRLIR